MNMDAKLFLDKIILDADTMNCTTPGACAWLKIMTVMNACPDTMAHPGRGRQRAILVRIVAAVPRVRKALPDAMSGRGIH